MHNIMKLGYWDASSVLIPGIREKGGVEDLSTVQKCGNKGRISAGESAQ